MVGPCTSSTITQLCPGVWVSCCLPACLAPPSAVGNQAWYFISLLHFAESVKFPTVALFLHDPHLFQNHSLGARTPKETSDPSLSSKQCSYLDACHPACHRQATLPKHTQVPPPRASPSMKPDFISQTLPAALPWQTRTGCQWCETRIQWKRKGLHPHMPSSVFPIWALELIFMPRRLRGPVVGKSRSEHLTTSAQSLFLCCLNSHSHLFAWQGALCSWVKSLHRSQPGVGAV